MQQKKNNAQQQIHRYLDDLYTVDELQSILESLDDEESFSHLHQAARDTWEEAGFQEPASEEKYQQYKIEAQQLLQKLEPKKKTFRRYQLKYATIVAATLTLFIIIPSLFSLYHLNEKPEAMYEIITGAGEKKEIMLPDSSYLVLNACSKLKYPSSMRKGDRRIYLEGEAFFRVTPNQQSPFIVTTAGFEVCVLGTSFNIKAYQEDEITSVRVESGRVQVNFPEAMQRLSKNEEIIFNSSTEEFRKHRREGETSPWIKGGLRFNYTPIHDVAKELERFYNCTIIFKEGQDFNNLISGEHDNISLEAVLQSITYISGIHYIWKENYILLYK